MEKGSLIISNDVFTQIAGAVATSCFGVKGMAVRSKTDGLVHLLRRESMSKGVKVTANEDGSVTIDLHIIVDSGVNIAAISSSITKEVAYKVTEHDRRERGQCGDLYRLDFVQLSCSAQRLETGAETAPKGRNIT